MHTHEQASALAGRLISARMDLQIAAEANTRAIFNSKHPIGSVMWNDITTKARTKLHDAIAECRTVEHELIAALHDSATPPVEVAEAVRGIGPKAGV